MIRCMEKDNLSGRQESLTKVFMRKIWSMGLEGWYTKTGQAIMGIGRRENSMEKDNL